MVIAPACLLVAAIVFAGSAAHPAMFDPPGRADAVATGATDVTARMNSSAVRVRMSHLAKPDGATDTRHPLLVPAVAATGGALAAALWWVIIGLADARPALRRGRSGRFLRGPPQPSLA